MLRLYGVMIGLVILLIVVSFFVHSVAVGAVSIGALALLCAGLAYDGPILLEDSDTPVKELTAIVRLRAYWRWYKLYSNCYGPGQKRITASLDDLITRDLKRREIRLSGLDFFPTPIAEGGESHVYLLKGDSRTALKLFKRPEDPSHAFDSQRSAARVRLSEHQTKLGKFPLLVPQGIVAPQALVRDDQGSIVGYTMEMVQNAKPLRDFIDCRSGRSGMSTANYISIIAELLQIIEATHDAGMVIGDLNPDNVLVSAKGVHVIDSDSFQFGEFRARTYSERYLIPTNCDASKDAPVLSGCYTADQDYYAAMVMLFEGLLDCHPYFSGLQSKNLCSQYGKPFVPLNKRGIAGISVFSPTVEYPAGAVPIASLPQALREFFEEYFGKNRFGLRLKTEVLAALAGGFPLSAATRAAMPPHLNMVQDTYRPSEIRRATRRKALRGTVQFAQRNRRKMMHITQSSDGSLCYLQKGKPFAAPPAGTLVPIALTKERSLWEMAPLKGAAEQGGLMTTPKGGQKIVHFDYDSAGNPAATFVGEALLFVKKGWLQSMEGSVARHEKEIGEEFLFLPGSEIGAIVELSGGTYRGCTLWREEKKKVQLAACSSSVSVPGTVIEANFLSDEYSGWLFLKVSVGHEIRNYLQIFDNRGKLLVSGMQSDGIQSFLGSIRGKAVVTMRYPMHAPRSVMLTAAAGPIVLAYERLEAGLTCTEMIRSPKLAAALRNGAEINAHGRTLRVFSGEQVLIVKMRHPVNLAIEMARRRLRNTAPKGAPKVIPAALWTALATTLLDAYDGIESCINGIRNSAKRRATHTAGATRSRW